MIDKGLIQSVRPESADVRGQQTTLFPFDAFVFSSGRDGGTRYLDLKNGWNLVIRGDVRVGSDLKSEGFAEGVKGWILRGDGTAEFNALKVRFYINEKIHFIEDAVIIGPAEGYEGFRTFLKERGVEIWKKYGSSGWYSEGHLRHEPYEPFRPNNYFPFELSVIYDIGWAPKVGVPIGSPIITFGRLKHCAKFNGTSEGMYIIQHAAPMFVFDGILEWSSGVWINISTVKKCTLIHYVDDDDSWFDFFRLFIDDEGNLGCTINGVTTYNLDKIEAGVWVHYGIQHDKTKGLLYKNGIPLKDNIDVGPMPDVEEANRFTNVYIGCKRVNSPTVYMEFTDCLIQDFMYSIGSGDEMAVELYYGGTAGSIVLKADVIEQPSVEGSVSYSGIVGNLFFKVSDSSSKNNGKRLQLKAGDYIRVKTYSSPVINKVFRIDIISQGLTELQMRVNVDRLYMVPTFSNVAGSITLVQRQDTNPNTPETVIGSATFTKSTNKIAMSELDDLDLEIGDVIQVIGANEPENEKIFTCEMVDPGEVDVNWEHRNGAGPLSLETETATVTVKLLSKWYNAPLGLGQAWVDVRANRVAGTKYTNTTGRTIQIAVAGGVGSQSNGDMRMYLDELVLGQNETGSGTGRKERDYNPVIVNTGSYTVMTYAMNVSFLELR